MAQPEKHILESKTGTRVLLNGKSYLYFAGTSYFQLHAHPEVIKAASEATQKPDIGVAFSQGNRQLGRMAIIALEDFALLSRKITPLRQYSARSKIAQRMMIGCQT